MQQALPAHSRSSSPADGFSPRHTQEPRLFRDASVELYADITDEGALAALSALRSSPASTPEHAEKSSRGSSVDVFGQKRYLHEPGSASQPATSTRAKTTSAGGAKVSQPDAVHPASDGPERSRQAATKKRKRRGSPAFTLEIFASKSPRKRAAPARPPLEPAQPVASTSRVTLDDLADGSPDARDSRAPASQSARSTAELERQTKGISARRPDMDEAVALDYNSDSDDPLAVPIRPVRGRSPSKGIRPMGRVALTRSDLSDEGDSDEEEESQIVQRALLAKASRLRATPTSADDTTTRPRDAVAQPRNGRLPARRPPLAQRDLPKPPRKPSLAGKIRPGDPRTSSQGAPARPRITPRSAPLSNERLQNVPAAAEAAPPSPFSRPSGVRSDVAGPIRRKRPRSQSEASSYDESESTPPIVARQGPPVQKKSAARAQARGSARDEVMQHPRGPSRPGTSPMGRPRSSSRDSVEIEDGDDGPLHVGKESGNGSEQAPTPARPPPTEPKSTKKRKKRKSIVMPRSKGRRRPSTAMSKPTNARSPSSELTASPEPVPRASATKAGSKRRRAEAGGRGSKKARQAHDHAEWGEDESD